MATFSNLSLNKAASGYSLLVSPAGLATVTSSTFNVTAGAASQLIVSGLPPVSVTAGSNFGVAITAQDSQGNVATRFTGSVTLSLANNPGASTLGGTLSGDGRRGHRHVLRAYAQQGRQRVTRCRPTAMAVIDHESGFNVVPGAATQLVITTPPPATVTAGSCRSVTR